LHRQLVEAGDGAFFIKRKAVQVQDIFHPRQVLARNPADAPLLAQVWLQPVFFRICLTALWLTSSTKPSVTAR
jgi:hypothetical protein